jgi:four helix bundle protein
MTLSETFDPLRRVQAYQLALEAVREGREDARIAAADPVLRDVGAQLVRAVASIAANIAEGYSRGSTADRRRFLEYALGSTRETIVWYEASGLPESPTRIARLVTIRRLLLTMIRNSRSDAAADREKFK